LKILENLNADEDFFFLLLLFQRSMVFFKEYEKKEKGRDAETHTHIYPILFVSR
tara:strand:- start:865 stop:1026 length:162 start_codon:yes stop_codon:yes gene_type:complete